MILQKTFVADPISKKKKVNNGELSKYHIKNSYEGIVSHDLFNKVQEKRAKRSNKQKISVKTKTENGKYSSLYALGEIIVCGDCGTPYQRKVWTKRDGTKQPVWRCVSRLDHGTKYCENSPTVDETALHEAIVEAIFTEFQELQVKNGISAYLESQLRQVLRSPKENDFNIPEAEAKIEELKAKVMELIAIHTKTNTLSLHAEEMKALSDEAKALSEKIVQHKVKPEEVDVDLKVNQIADFYKLVQGFPREYNDSVVRQIIHTIKVIDGETLEIFFKNGVVIRQTMEGKVRKLRAS